MVLSQLLERTTDKAEPHFPRKANILSAAAAAAAAACSSFAPIFQQKWKKVRATGRED